MIDLANLLISLGLSIGISLLILAIWIKPKINLKVNLLYLVIKSSYFLKLIILFLGLTILFYTIKSMIPESIPCSVPCNSTNSQGGNAEVILAVIALSITILMTGILFLAKNAIQSLKEEKEQIKSDVNSFINTYKNDVLMLKEQSLSGELTDLRFSISHQNDKEIETHEFNIKLDRSALTNKQNNRYQFRQGAAELYQAYGNLGIKNYLSFLNSFEKKDGVYLFDIEKEYLDKLKEYYETYYNDDDKDDVVNLVHQARRKW